MRVLITGVSGYIGSNIATWLKQNTDLWVIGVYNNRPPQGIFDEAVSCNLADYSSKKILDNIECDIVIHAAGCFIADSILGYISNNVKATENILCYAYKKNVKKFVYISTTSVYGETSEEISESSSSRNLSDYGMVKKICERMVEESVIQSKLILRLSSTLGGSDNDFTRPWLPKVAYRMLKNMDIIYYNPHLYYNAVVYVKDVAKFIGQFIIKEKLGYYDYILASSNPMQILEILNLLKDEIGSRSILLERETSEANRCFALNVEKAINDGFYVRSVEEVIKCFAIDILQQEKQTDLGE